MNILSVINGHAEKAAADLSDTTTLPVSSEENISYYVKTIFHNLVLLNACGISVFDACACLSISDEAAQQRFIQLVLKDLS